MTLGKQLIFSGLIVILGLFAGMIVFTTQNTQQFLNHQLAVHSQDTATVLGLSLSYAVKDNDPVLAARVVDSIWDAGYYQKIVVQSLEGKNLVSKQLKIKVAGVPSWFIQWLDLKTEMKEATIQSGWMQTGKVYVESNPGFAYRQIWETCKDSFVWLCFIALIGLLLGLGLLHIILKPLRAVTAQAEAIFHQDFQVQSRLPRTFDLRQVVLAMNKMSTRLKSIFEEQARVTEQLRNQAYMSPVTGLGNRRYFDMQFQYLMEDATGSFSGVLLLVELHDFKIYNDTFGYQKGDEFLAETSKVLQEHSKGLEQVILAHLGGADFALLIPNKTIETGKELSEKILFSFHKFLSQGITTSENVGHIGVCAFNFDDSQREVLSKVDAALRAAQNQGANQYSVHYEVPATALRGAQEWGQLFDQVVADRSVVLHFQPFTYDSAKERVCYEVLLRLKDEQGTLIPAGLFIPMAERLQRMTQLDYLVLEVVFERIVKEEAKQHYSVNLAASSLDQEDFIANLLSKVKKLGKKSQALVIELPEYGVVHRSECVKELFRNLRNLGVRTTIDHYGRHFTSFAYLQSLSLSFLKIDGSYIRGIQTREDNQFFIRSLVNIAHSLDIQVIAESVESKEEWDTLKELKVDGIQGYVLGKPKEFIDSNEP